MNLFKQVRLFLLELQSIEKKLRNLDRDLYSVSVDGRYTDGIKFSILRKGTAYEPAHFLIGLQGLELLASSSDETMTHSFVQDLIKNITGEQS